MKNITYRIFKGERSKNYSFELPQDVFDFLDSPIFGIHSGLIPRSITNQIDDLQNKYYDIHYDIIYWILENRLGIGSSDIEELTVEDYRENEIIVHVYLGIR